MRTLLLLTFLLQAWGSFAQEQATDSIKKVHVLPVPAIGYSPETGLYFGAVALFTINLYGDTITRTSNATLEINYSLNKQLILETDWSYFFREEAWFTEGLIHYSKYPDLYYGVGPHTLQKDELLYQHNRITADVEVLRKIGKQLFLGGGARHVAYDNLNTFNTENVFPELNNQSTTGLKLVFLKDHRNNILNSTQGSLIALRSGFNWSASNYGKLSLDLRKYFSWQQKQTVALRAYNAFTFGTPPFFDYNLLGGDQFARGYYFGRFRDAHLSTLQIESRTTFFKHFGLAVFGGVSSTYPTLDALSFSNVKPNAGIGLRYRVFKAENINLRLDYARGSDGQSGFYISFGESF